MNHFKIKKPILKHTALPSNVTGPFNIFKILKKRYNFFNCVNQLHGCDTCRRTNLYLFNILQYTIDKIKN